MKTLSCTLSLLLAVSAAAEVRPWARKVIHGDGKETESTVDIQTSTLTQLTYHNKVVTVKRVFTLDNKGRVRSGMIFDGKKSHLYSTAYGFDKFDRVNEERWYNPRQQVIKRILFGYTPEGQMLPAKVWVWDPNNTNATPKQIIDDKAKPTLPVQEGDREAPGLGIPELRDQPGAPTPPAAPAPTPPPAAKPENGGWLKRLFKKDK